MKNVAQANTEAMKFDMMAEIVRSEGLEGEECREAPEFSTRRNRAIRKLIKDAGMSETDVITYMMDLGMWDGDAEELTDDTPEHIAEAKAMLEDYQAYAKAMDAARENG